MPPLIRRPPLSERIKAYLDPWDYLLSISESLDSSDWDLWQEQWATTLGIGLNFVFLIARANSGAKIRRGDDDVFGDDSGGLGVVSWLATLIVHVLTVLSIFNALHTFLRKRHYRLFETNIDAVPSTPSAQRVKVDSSPLSSSPLRFISNIILPQKETAESRAHPDSARDVWELAIWDPTPLSLKLFCLFSPGHILVYWLFLPISISDPRPSTTVLTTIFLTTLLSLQLTFLHTNYTQQIKDSAVVSKEVLHEYDTKFVHPRTRPLMRDVGTQFTSSSSDPYAPHSNSKHDRPTRRKSAIVPGGSPSVNHVETHTPRVIINRGFQTYPNRNYRASLGGGQGGEENITPSRGPPVASNSIPVLTTPVQQRDVSSPIRAPSSALQPQPQLQMRPNGVIQQQPPNVAGAPGGGGSLGVYSHMGSPLRRQMPSNYAAMRERDRSMSPRKRDREREGSPLKRGVSVGVGGGMNGYVGGQGGGGGGARARKSGYY